DQVCLCKDRIYRQVDRQPLFELLDTPPDSVRMVKPRFACRRTDFGQCDRNDNAVEWLASAGVLEQVEKRRPASTIDPRVRVLRRIAAGGVDQHRILGEPPVAKARPTDPGHGTLPHLGREWEAQSSI